MKIKWTEHALETMTAIKAYLLDVAGEEIAGSMTQTLFQKGISLSAFPKRGRVVPEIGNPYILEIFSHRYRIIYKIDSIEAPSEISILGIAHEAQLLESVILETF